MKRHNQGVKLLAKIRRKMRNKLRRLGASEWEMNILSQQLRADSAVNLRCELTSLRLSGGSEGSDALKLQKQLRTDWRDRDQGKDNLGDFWNAAADRKIKRENKGKR